MKTNNYYKFMDFMKTIDEENDFTLKNRTTSALGADFLFKIIKDSKALDRLRRKFDLQVTEIMQRFNILENDTRDKMNSIWNNLLIEASEFKVKDFFELGINAPKIVFRTVDSARAKMWKTYKEKVNELVEKIAAAKFEQK